MPHTPKPETIEAQTAQAVDPPRIVRLLEDLELSLADDMTLGGAVCRGFDLAKDFHEPKDDEIDAYIDEANEEAALRRIDERVSEALGFPVGYLRDGQNDKV